jgi:trigger factor
MQLTERRSEGLLRVYDIVVPAADLELKLVAKIEEVRPRVRINGFRPGKVPASHIRKLYGPSMMQDIINETVQSSTKESLEKVKAKPASEPTLDLKSDMEKVMAGASDLEFEISLEIMPDFEPVDLKTISITRPVSAVTDEQVEQRLSELARANIAYEDKDGEAAKGDAVIVNFVGKIDGEAFEGGAAEGAQVVIGSNQFITGFEEQLIGAKADDERVLKVNFPDDYPAANLKGKAAEFDTKIITVKAPKSSEPTEEWAAQLGFEGLAPLKEALKQRLDSEHGQQSRAKAKRALFDALDATHNFELPPRMVEAEFQQIWRQVEGDIKAGNLDPSDEGKDEAALKADYKKIAERRVRLGLLLAEIGRRHKLEVTDQEVAQAISAQARNFPGQERQVFEAYQRNPNLVAQIKAPLYEEKVVDYLLELVTVKDEAVDRDALFAEDEGAPA